MESLHLSVNTSGMSISSLFCLVKRTSLGLTGDFECILTFQLNVHSQNRFAKTIDVDYNNVWMGCVSFIFYFDTSD